ncbi:MAG: N-acetyltransferase family protein [Bacilli bacterium]
MIRMAAIEDMTEILKIIADAKALLKSKHSLQWQDDDGYPNGETFLDDIQTNSLYVACDQGRLVAVCALGRFGEPTYNVIYDGQWLNNEPFYVVHRLAVKKEAYGQGWAKKLMKKMEEICLDEGVKNIRCDTTFENEPMNQLLINLDYQYCGIIHLTRTKIQDRLRKAYQKRLF